MFFSCTSCRFRPLPCLLASGSVPFGKVLNPVSGDPKPECLTSSDLDVLLETHGLNGVPASRNATPGYGGFSPGLAVPEAKILRQVNAWGFCQEAARW